MARRRAAAAAARRALGVPWVPGNAGERAVGNKNSDRIESSRRGAIRLGGSRSEEVDRGEERT